MKNKTNINIRVDSNVKYTAEKLFESMGLNMSTAINIFLRQAIRKGGLPFEVVVDVSNELTENAILEGSNIAIDKNVQSYKNISELKNALK